MLTKDTYLLGKEKATRRREKASLETPNKLLSKSQIMGCVTNFLGKNVVFYTDFKRLWIHSVA